MIWTVSRGWDAWACRHMHHAYTPASLHLPSMRECAHGHARTRPCASARAFAQHLEGALASPVSWMGSPVSKQGIPISLLGVCPVQGLIQRSYGHLHIGCRASYRGHAGTCTLGAGPRTEVMREPAHRACPTPGARPPTGHTYA